MSATLAAELAELRHAEEVMHLLGRALEPWHLSTEQIEAIREDAQERAAIAGEGGFPGALSNSPTRGKDQRAAERTRARASALRQHLRAGGGCDRLRARLALMRRSVGIAARGHEAARQRQGFRPDRAAFVTLTYRPGVEWEAQHVKEAIRRARQWLKSQHQAALRYVWVAELQQRGAVHYHAVFWLPFGVKLPAFDLAGWWPHGRTDIQTARDSIAYLMKYLSKGGGVQFPPGLRTHGAGGLEHAYRRAKRWLRYPAFIKARADIEDDWRPARGGGWWDPDGVLIPSEYARAWIGDRYACIKVADYGRPFNPVGPFSWVKKG